MLFLGWASIFGLGTSLVNIISSVYVGFAPTVLGGIVGAVWGFIDGAIGGIVISSRLQLRAEKEVVTSPPMF